MPMNIQEAYRTPNWLEEKRNSSSLIIIKTPNTQNKENVLKAVREKGQVIYKGRTIRIIPDFSPETMKARRSWVDVIQTLREHKCQARLLYPVKLLSIIDGKKQDISQQNQIYTNLSRSLDLKDNKWKTPTWGGILCPRKNKKIIFF